MDAAPSRPVTLLARIPFLHLGLFLATLGTTAFAGVVYSGGDFGSVEESLLGGLPFAVAIVSILLCHEMGHYLMARAYGVDTSLPFFIPVPFGAGTFGAIIRIRSAMPSVRAVFDIGVAGPFAGFVVAVPLYAWGLLHSSVRAVGDLALEPGHWSSVLGIARAIARRALSGEWPPLQAERYGSSVVTALVERWIVGPLPADVILVRHPVAIAAWIGLFITTLNLMPLGQLDGGHATYALLGERRALRASRLVSWLLLASGLLLSWNWLVWWIVARFAIGPAHPAPLQVEPLDPRRRLVAVAALALFALTFVPIPLSF